MAGILMPRLLRLPPRGYPDNKLSLGLRAIKLSYAHENGLGRTAAEGRFTVAITAPLRAKPRAELPGPETYPDESVRGKLTLIARTIGDCGRSETATGAPSRAAGRGGRGATARVYNARNKTKIK